MSVKPIKPSQIVEKKRESIPDEIFQVFNELISRHWNGSSSTVYQKEALRLIVDRLGVTPEKVFMNGWLDIEGSYRKEGWRVIYDKPGFNESGEPYFQFRKK